jgi:hypothetical protein
MAQEGPQWDPMVATYWQVTDGLETFVVRGSRTRLEEPLRYQLLPGQLVQEAVSVEIPEEDIRERLDHTLYPGVVPERRLSAKIEVPTVEGKTQLRVPPGTQSGQKFRLRERGAPSLRNPGAKGHQFVEVQVTLPKVISEETKELLREYSKLNVTNPRVEMGLE